MHERGMRRVSSPRPGRLPRNAWRRATGSSRSSPLKPKCTRRKRLGLDRLRSLRERSWQGFLAEPTREVTMRMRTTATTRRRCLDCGAEIRGDWSWCARCWHVKRASARSLHWQLERVAAQLFDQAQLVELNRLKLGMGGGSAQLPPPAGGVAGQGQRESAPGR